MTRAHVAAALAAALFATTAAGPALAAEKGWYVGAGVGYADAKIDVQSINPSLSPLPPGTATISEDHTGVLTKLFLGYSFTSFVALEASAFWTGTFGTDTTIPSMLTASVTGETLGASLDVLGIIPLGNWRLFGRAGGLYGQTTLNVTGNVVGTVINIKQREYGYGYKFGAGVGYEFDSGVAFRAEWEQYHNAEWSDVEIENVNVYSASALYRFK